MSLAGRTSKTSASGKDKGSKVIVQGDVNGDGRADFEIYVAASSLAKGDFLLQATSAFGT